ncbi:MAG TPA: GNAT family N-acetyltransferase [Candidatus Wallbacteria bacterium]|nr:GNAT family N-acetyltransferase [Candidatus Wallbacteria bacterium]
MKITAYISRVEKNDLNDIIEIENDIFGCDSFTKSQFTYALKNEKAVFIKAEIMDGRGSQKYIAGYAMGFIRKAGKPGNQHLSARLYSIAVAGRARGMSVGKALLSEFHNIVKGRGCVNVYLEVRTDNAGAIKLYENFGYKRKCLIADYYHDHSPAFKYFKNDL